MSEIDSLSFQSDVNLAPYNTLSVEATARTFISVQSEKQLREVLQHKKVNTSPVFVLGGGSNVLFVDNFDGVILHIAIAGKKVRKEDDEYIWLEFGAGENWHQTVLYCVERGWGGIENLSLIPGTVGAAPIQNIGAYGVELREVFHSLTAVEKKTGELKTFSKDECRFGYRDSIFKNKLKGKYIVTRVTLKLSKHPGVTLSYGAVRSRLKEKGITHPSIRDVSNVVIEIRNEKLPHPEDLGNAGSFFKNPIVSRQKFVQLKRINPSIPGYELNDIEIKVPAAWLIEQAGWKGKVVGNAGTYQQQALVIVNHGGATGREILSLAQKIRGSVEQKFGIELVPEVNIVT